VKNPVDSRYVLITGGAGFIGTNLAKNYLRENKAVHIFDNLSRTGVHQNVDELLHDYPGRVLFTNADVRDRDKLSEAVGDAAAVFHLAAQVAVTTSLDDPRRDLETNLIGTVNVLEAIRHSNPDAPLLFTSTNKVYGRLCNIVLQESGTRWAPDDPAYACRGVPETQPLEFLSPYGCSKGSADQYVLDYAASYGLKAIVFRMSCIYGPHQCGSEDQGWVAHFVRQALAENPITIYGDGKQVRDLLFVDDLVAAMRLAEEHVDRTAGQAFNIGGGSANAASLLELISELRSAAPDIRIHWGPERLADQRWYVSDISKAKMVFGWEPRVCVRSGLSALWKWTSEHGSWSKAAQVA
jgi:CDP-paratose 2-epimerase